METDLQSRLGRALGPAYEVESEIGRGGMAIVYRAQDTRLKRAVAIKLLPPDLAFRADIRSRFLREAEMDARLSHPNIVPIYSVDERDGLVYFVMALVKGESVGDRLRRTGALPVADARRILREVADALAYAHARGVVHRDVKPDNVLLDAESGRALVTDFGIARAASEDDGGSRLTATGAALGTPAYMSPEQCAGDTEVDGRSDLYSLGAVAYQMLAGVPPFSGGNTPSIMMKQVMETPVPLRQRRVDVPDDLERIVMRLLEKNPGNRFADGAALVAALDGAPLTPLEPARPLSRSTREVLPPIVTRAIERPTRRDSRALRRETRGLDRPLAERLRRFRGRLVSYAGTSLFLFGINYATTGGHGFWWFAFPVLGMGLGIVNQMGRLMADGASLGNILSGTLPSADPALSAGGAVAALGGGVTDDVRNGPFGGVLRQAMVDHETVNTLLGALTDTERKMLPDVKGTADALFARVVALGTALQRLEGHTSGELVRARASLLEQYETAGLLLRNVALDMFKVRSSDLDSALGGLTSATQQARVLSREIGYVLGAADELRDLGSKP